MFLVLLSITLLFMLWRQLLHCILVLWICSVCFFYIGSAPEVNHILRDHIRKIEKRSEINILFSCRLLLPLWNEVFSFLSKTSVVFLLLFQVIIQRFQKSLSYLLSTYTYRIILLIFCYIMHSISTEFCCSLSFMMYISLYLCLGISVISATRMTSKNKYKSSQNYCCIANICTT